MDSMNDKLRRELGEGPLARNGFNDQLRRRIMEGLDEKPSKGRRGGVLRAGMLGLFSVLVACMVLTIVHLQENQMKSVSQDNASMEAAAPAMNDRLNVTIASEDMAMGRESAVLIGLRNDSQSAEPYRTKLLVNRLNTTSKVAEGSGILLPHKMDFWRLTQLRVDEGKQIREGFVLMNETRMGREEHEAMLEAALRGENLIPKDSITFVGNQYVSFEGHTSGGLHISMHAIPSLVNNDYEGIPALLIGQNGVKRIVAELPEPYVGGPDLSKGVFEHWGLQRQSGRWVAVVPNVKGEGLLPLPLDVDASLTAYDELTVSWNTIRALQPAANDAFMSPAGDRLFILTDRRIFAYRMNGEEVKERLYEEELIPGDQVVMIQWALDSYVERWEREAGEMLGE